MCFRYIFLKLERSRLYVHIYMYYFKFLRLTVPIMDYTVTTTWYISWWSGWCYLTYFLYYNGKFRDLGPSHEIFDYSSEIYMGFYKTIGLRLLMTWAVWTYVANFVFLYSIYYILHKLFMLQHYRIYWYEFTLYSCIEMFILNFFNSIYDSVMFLWVNYTSLELLDYNYSIIVNSVRFLQISQVVITDNFKTISLWFPWQSFFSYLTVFGLLYTFTLLAIYNSDNNYYIVLYTIFLMFLFAANLVALDLDIFAGLLLMIESVVILMLFFLIIYLTPNISFNTKNQKWKVYIVLLIVITITTIYSYMNLGAYWFYPFSINSLFFDNFYEALHDLYVNDLMGIFVSMYITNSLLLVIIGLLLLIASIICVVLVSFFTKSRNYSFKNFLNIFTIFKTCYSFIFLRKQNLAKQGRSTASTRIFNKKTFDYTAHTEYREKQEIFEKKKKEEQKTNS